MGHTSYGKSIDASYIQNNIDDIAPVRFPKLGSDLAPVPMPDGFQG